MESAIALAVHVVAASLWVGGIFFSYVILQPAVSQALDPPARVKLWAATFEQYYRWALYAAVLLLISGYFLAYSLYGDYLAGGWRIWLMQALGILLMLNTLHARFAPFRRLQKTVINKDWARGAVYLTQLRKQLLGNLVLGLAIVIIASGGRYFSLGNS